MTRQPVVVGVDLEAALDAMPQLVWLTGPDGSTEWVNEQFRTYTGCPADMVAGWDSAIHPDEADDATLAWDLAGSVPHSFEVECRLRRADGQYRWHRLQARPLHAQAGSAQQWLGTGTDIDDAKRLDVDLRTSQRTTAETLALLQALQNAPIGLGFVDRDLRRVFVNDALASYNGSTVAEQLGRRVPDLVPAVWPQMEPMYRAVLDEGATFLDVDIHGPSATDPTMARDWSTSYYPATLHGEVIGVGVVAWDISDRKRSEDLDRRLAAIVENSDDAMLAYTCEGVVTSWNLGAARLFGYTDEEMIGRSVAVLVPADRLDAHDQVRARICAGGPTERHETQRRRKDGSLVDVLVTASPTRGADGEIVGLSVIMQDIAERLGFRRKLQASQHQLAVAQRIAGVGSFAFEIATGQPSWSDQFRRILGLDATVEASVDLYLSMIHPDDRALIAATWDDVVQQGMPAEASYRIIRSDLQERHVHGYGEAEFAEDGTIISVVGTMQDVTDQIEADRVRRRAEARFEAAFEQAGIGTGILDLDGVPLRVNAAGATIMGRPQEELINRNWNSFRHPDDLPVGEAMAARGLPASDSYHDERRFLRPDASVVWTSMHLTTVRDEAGQPEYYLAQLLDITERKQMEDDLAHQALHDSLTGLANRTLLTDRLAQALAGTRRRSSQLGVIFLDLDQFKLINDSLGHGAGDDLIRHVADRLSAANRASELLVEQLDAIAAGVLRLVHRHVRVAEQAFGGGFGVGDGDADAGGDAHLAVGDGVGAAHELQVHYQPVVDLETGRLVSAEALLRWERPGFGFVSPIEFVPVAEDTGLILPIGAWVLEQACRQLVQWQRSSPSMSLAVNLSVRQVLAPDIATQIEEVLRRTGVTPDSLCLELTESVFMGDVDYFVTTLTALKGLGVRLSIDDFGTGYSSLSYLSRFPVDAVKIDRAFVNGLGINDHDTAVITAILSMADALGLQVTAEGIENQEQLAALKSLHCARAQGFHLARPMPADEMDRLVHESRRWSLA